MLYDVQGFLTHSQIREQHVAISKATSGKALHVNGVTKWRKSKFATSAYSPDFAPEWRRVTTAAGSENWPPLAERRAGEAGENSARLEAIVWSLANQNAEASAGNGAGLSGHGPVQALALKRSGEVDLAAAAAEKAGKELHDTCPGKEGYTGCLRALVWGRPLVGFDIVPLKRLFGRECEVSGRESDTASGARTF